MTRAAAGQEFIDAPASHSRVPEASDHFGGEFDWRVAGDQVAGAGDRGHGGLRHEFEQPAGVGVCHGGVPAPAHERDWEIQAVRDRTQGSSSTEDVVYQRLVGTSAKCARQPGASAIWRRVGHDVDQHQAGHACFEPRICEREQRGQPAERGANQYWRCGDSANHRGHIRGEQGQAVGASPGRVAVSVSALVVGDA